LGFENPREKDPRFAVLWKAVQQMRMSVKCKDRRNGLKMVKQCFLGSEAVDFLIMKGHARSRKESEDIGNELINLGMIMHASGAEAFRDSRACYVFVDSPLYGPMRQPPEQQSRNIAMKEGGFIFASAVLKLGGAFKNKLQQRYMEIERIDSRIEIKYYNNIRKDPKGVILVTGDCKVEESSKPRKFSLVTMDRTFSFQTLTRQHKELWCNILLECISIRMAAWKEERINKLPKDPAFRKKVTDFVNIIELGEHKHKKTGTHILRCFRGKEAVDTILHYGIAETPHQAVVFGNKLIEHRIIKSYCNEHPFENKKHLYLLFFPETSSKKEGLVEEKASRRTRSFILPEDFMLQRHVSKMRLESPSLKEPVGGARTDKARGAGGKSSNKHSAIDTLAPPRKRRGSGTSAESVSTATTTAASDVEEEEEEEDPKKMSFSSTIPHCLDAVADHVRKSLQNSKSMHGYLAQMIKAELRFAEQQMKAVRTVTLTQADTVLEQMRDLMITAHDASERHFNAANKRLRQLDEAVLRPWKESLSASSAELKSVEKKYKKAREKREEVVRQLENTFKCCNQLTHKMKKKIAKKMHGESGAGSEKKKLKRFAGMFNKGAERKTEDLLKQLEKMSNEYNDQLGVANKATVEFDANCAALSHKVQVIGSKQLVYTKKYLHQWAKMTIDQDEENLQQFTKFFKRTERYSASSDIRDYIVRMRRKQGRKPKIERFTYDLPYTLAEIKNGQFNRSDSIFDQTLENVMKIQKEADNRDVASLDVPAIVLVLIASVQSLGGLTTEGIFRISAAKKDIDRLKEQINQGNYQVKEKSPHVAAGLLKLWIRNLPEPLIPSHLYEEAVKIGKKQSEIQAADIRKFTSKIPVLNRRVIDYIATLAKEIEKLKDVNRMDMTNIAIVFAPGMLQDPGDDPAVMLANSKYEIKFTVALFTHFPHSDESEASR